MNQESFSLENFRVPKKKNKEIIEPLKTESDQRKFLIAKISESFKKPDISKTAMKFHRSWVINIAKSEAAFSKKRLVMRNSSTNCSESFGFLFVKAEFEMKKLVDKGGIEVGNLAQSFLATPTMGVSLSQHADIYHPELPRSGIILIVRYMKGKVHYIPFDSSPMEPQPNYDCHIVRSNLPSDPSIHCSKAFHMSQVFIYEYSEDLDIQRFPSHILIIGAVQFSWHGPYIYREYPRTDIIANSTKNALKRQSTYKPESSSAKKKQLSHSQHAPPKAVVIHSPNLEPEVISTTLIIGKSAKPTSQTPSFRVKLLSRLKEPIMISNLISQNWNLIELLPSKILEDYLCYTDQNNIERYFMLSPTSIKTFPNRFNDNKKMGPTFRPKHALHLTLAPESLKDKKMMLKTIENLKSTNTVGLIRCNSMSNIMFYVFPGGKTSKVLGLSGQDCDNSLHAILLTQQHPQFLPCTYASKDKKEQQIFQEILLALESSPNQKTANSSLISLADLKNAATIHWKLQKLFNSETLPKQSPAALEPQQNGENIKNDSDMEVDSNADSDSNHLAKDNNENLAIRPIIPVLEPNCSVKPGLLVTPNTSLFAPIASVTSASCTTKSGLLPYPQTLSFLANVNITGPYSFPPPPLPPHPLPLSPIQSAQTFPPVLETKVICKQQDLVPISVNEPLLSSPMQTTVSQSLLDNVKLVPCYFGYFTLNSRKYKPNKLRIDRSRFTNRRPVYLDSGIFEKSDEMCHITVYKG